MVSSPQYPKLHSLVTEHDHGPMITIASAYCMSIMLLFFGVRLSIRYPFAALFSYDDWAVAAATALATAYSTLIMIAVRFGLGSSMNENLAEVSTSALQMFYAASLLYVLALGVGKLSVALLLFRVSASQSQHRIAGAISTAVIIWTAGSFVAIAVRPDISQPWKQSAAMFASLRIRWIVVESIGLMFEILVLGFVVSLVWRLHTGRGTKVAVITGFLWRLPLFAMVPIRLYYNSITYIPSTSSLGLALTMPEILVQIEMHYNIISATIPCLRIFLRSFHSGYLSGIGLEAPGTYRSRYGSALATKGTRDGQSSRAHGSRGRVNVRTSVELQSLDAEDTHRSRRVVENDAASDGSANPLYDSRAVTDIYSSSRG